jgi:hypothetical protein
VTRDKEMQQPGILKVLKTALIALLTIFVASCALQAPFTTSDAGVKAPRHSPELIRDFEQQIAAQLLASIPDLPKVKTTVDIEALIKQLDAVLNQSGINKNLLTPEQRQQFSELDSILTQLRNDLPEWRQRNHLTDLHYGLGEQITTPNNSQPGNQLTASQLKERQKLIDAITTNLLQQENAEHRYPIELIQAIRPSALQIGITNSLLDKSAASTTAWFRNRLEPYFENTDYAKQLEKLQSLIVPVEIESETKALYRSPSYDIRNEASPEQLTLDLVSLHLEEALVFGGFDSILNIRGFDQGLMAPLTGTDETLNLDFSKTMAMPAYELQTMAYQSSGYFLVVQSWSFRWRETLAIAQGYWLANQLHREAYFTNEEANTGFIYRQQLIIHFGILEIMMAIDDADLSMASAYLLANTPYTETQVKMLILELLESDGSYAAAAILANGNAFPELVKLDPIKQPESLRMLEKQLSEVTDSAGF